MTRSKTRCDLPAKTEKTKATRMMIMKGDPDATTAEVAVDAAETVAVAEATGEVMSALREEDAILRMKKKNNHVRGRPNRDHEKRSVGTWMTTQRFENESEKEGGLGTEVS